MIKKLLAIQTELKAPKGQENKFGGYKYRSCEDIMEAVKPLLAKHNCALTVTDDITAIGDRVYVKATAILWDCDSDNKVENTSFAREALSRKGMDDSQITGATSSYARKYALNGLFCIDDTKDADATNTHGKDEEIIKIEGQKISDLKVKSLRRTMKTYEIDEKKLCELYKVSKLEDLTEKMLSNINQNWDKVKEKCNE